MLIQERLYIATLCRGYEHIFVSRLGQTTTQIEIEIYLCENKVIHM